jgi:Concanavalin A-like lectin/glucanases superfamily
MDVARRAVPKLGSQRNPFDDSHGTFSVLIVAALLLGAACGLFLWEPWHGPVVLSLSEGHGVDAGDLPALLLIAIAVAIGHSRARDALARPRWWAGGRAGAAPAVVLGVLLLLAGIDTTGDPSLVPAGGGTFDGSTQHADGRRADPVDRWSHVAVTYDGVRLRLYVDGTQVSSRAITGTIRTTTDPLWIGGNRPYGEYFEGVIDEVRVYKRALGPSVVRAEMSTPIASRGISRAAGLVGAYAFDEGEGTVAADASGNGNAGTIHGAAWTPRGRFGRAVRFDGAGAVVRVPGSTSLNLGGAMTLSAWLRPSESQSGWRTILHRQTDAYFLMAGGGRNQEDRPGALDDARVALLIVAAVWLCVALAGGRATKGERRGPSYWPPVALFLAGSVIDAVLAPSDTLIGPTLVAVWCAAVASHRHQAASMYFIAVVFTGVTVVSIAGPGGVELSRDDGGIARSAALGLLLVTAGLLSVRHGWPGEAVSRRRARPFRSAPTRSRRRA